MEGKSAPAPPRARHIAAECHGAELLLGLLGVVSQSRAVSLAVRHICVSAQKDPSGAGLVRPGSLSLGFS